MITNNMMMMINIMMMINRSKPVCEVEEEGEKREVCSFTYTQVFDIIIVITGIIVFNLNTIIFMLINFDLTTIMIKGSHTVAAVAVEMMLDLR